MPDGTAADPYDCVVIGGGATGLGVAHDLCLRGGSVTLYDRGSLAGGTTGHTHGVLHSGARYADADPDGARECIRENRVLRAIAGGAITETGGLFVQLDDDPAYVETKAAACRDCSIPVERLDATTLTERAPELRATATGGLAVPDAVIHPTRLVAGLAAAVRDAGGRVRSRTPVTDVTVDEGGVTVETATETVHARHVVNATGAWADRIAAMAGYEVPMRPTKGAMVVVDRPASAVLNRCRPADDGDIVVPSGDRAILGTTSAPVDDPDDYDREDAAVDRLVATCDALCPVDREDVISTYWGVRPIPAAAGDGRDASRGFQVTGDDRFTTVVGGKLTTYRLMAEATTDRVCAAIGIDAPCRTETVALPASPERLDALAREFAIRAPADAAVVGGGSK